MLESISNIIGCFCLVSVGLIFGYLLSDIKFTKRKIIAIAIITIVYSVGYNFIYFNTGNSIRSIINFVINTLIFKFLFNFKFTKAIFVAFLHLILLIFSEIIGFTILGLIPNIDEEFIYKIMAGGIGGNLIVSVTFIIMTLLLKKALKKLINYKVANNKIISTYAVLVIICILIFFFWGFSSKLSGITLITSVFAIGIFLIILFSLINQKIKNENLAKEYDNLIDFVKEYEMIIEKQRIDRHENKNTLVNIKSKLIDKNKREDIIEYIDSVLQEKTTFSKEKYAKLGYLPANGLKGLFYYKINHAENIGIKTSISIPEDVSKSLLYDLDSNNYKELCKILGVYLDNAIEASAISDDKTMGIEVYNRNDYVSVIISNSYKGEIDQDNIEKDGYSTKGSGRGYGLSVVKHIINKNTIFESKTVVIKKLYIQKLRIKKSITE